MKIYAWHFNNGQTLRDGRPLPAVGVKLVHDGPLELCDSGLHGSAHIIDALAYAPGNTVDRVLHTGEIIHGKDKLCSTERTALQRIDMSDVLRRFAWACAWRAEDYAPAAQAAAHDAWAAWAAWAAWVARAAARDAQAAQAAQATRAARAAQATRAAAWAAARASQAAWDAEEAFQNELLLAGLEAAGFDLTEEEGTDQ